MISIEALNNIAIEPLLLAIPETAGILVIGLGLISTAALLRKVFRVPTKIEADESLEDSV